MIRLGERYCAVSILVCARARALAAMAASQRAHAAVVYVLLLVAVWASTAGALGPAFAPMAGTARDFTCRSGVCLSAALRPAHRPSIPASTRASRAHSLVMMAKKKMTDAQLKALAALEQFEASTGVATAVHEVISPEEEEKKKKREEKKAKLAAKKGNAPVVNGDKEEDDDEAALKNGKDAPANGQSKKGKMSEMQLRALEAVEAFEKTGPDKSEDEGDQDTGKKDKQSKKQADANGKRADKEDLKATEEERKSPSVAFADDLDFLGLEDGGGRHKMSKKKQGKDKGKDKDKESESSVALASAAEMSDEDDTDVALPGARFTGFTGAKVHILTQLGKQQTERR